MNRINSEAIVVRVVDYGDADRVATLLLRAEGKVSALARGARRSRKRYGGLELFACGEATLRPGRGELWALEGFDVARGFPHLALDMARVAQAAYACELARELIPAHHGEQGAYDLLRSLLGHLDEGHAAGALGPAWLRVYELALLAALGLAPSIDRCVGCGRDLEPISAGEGHPAPGEGAGDRHFDLRRGGVVCEACSAGHGPGELPLSPAAHRLLLLAQRLPLVQAPLLHEAGLAREAWERARDVLQALLRQHVGHPLRSVEFIAKLNAAGS